MLVTRRLGDVRIVEFITRFRFGHLVSPVVLPRQSASSPIADRVGDFRDASVTAHRPEAAEARTKTPALGMPRRLRDSGYRERRVTSAMIMS